MTVPATVSLRELPVDGGLLRYDDRGDGEAVLLIHAGVFSGWFVPLAADRSLDGFRVIRAIRAGYGDGPMPVRPLTVAGHAAHCAALLDALGIGRAHVVAHSSGCLVAMQLAVDRPDAVADLVLSEPPLTPALIDPADGAIVGPTVGAAIGRAVAAAETGDDPAAYAAFMDAVCGPEHHAVVAAALGTDAVERAERESRAFFTGGLDGAHGWAFDEEVAARIVAPVLLVQGGASPPPVHRLVARIRGLLPDATIASIDGGDHLSPLRSPGALGELIAAFARRHPIAS